MFTRRKPGASRARQIHDAWALRALTVAALLAIVVTSAVALLLALSRPQERTPVPADVRTSNQFSLGVRKDELVKGVRAAHAAFKLYLKRDLVEKQLGALEAEFKEVESEGDLIQALSMLTAASGDRYFGLLTSTQYAHLSALQDGASIGVDATFDFEFASASWTVRSVGPTAEEEGLRVGDEIISVERLEMPGHADPEAAQVARQIMDGGGLLGSKVSIVVERGGSRVLLQLTREVTAYAPPFVVANMTHPLDNVEVQDLKTITFTHLRGPTLLGDLHHELLIMQASNVRGVAIDLRLLREGDGETAVRVAAMFLEKGVVARLIETTPEGGLIMKTYEIVDGRLHVHRRGPFMVREDGTLDTAPAEPDRNEVTDWPVNVYRGVVVALTGRETSGAGEVVMAAFSSSYTKDKSRAQTTAKFYSQGKGTRQTYFVLNDRYVLRLSTGFYLSPEGSAIEGELGPAPNVPSNPNVDEWWFARNLVVERLNVVPLPEWPGK